MYLGEPEPWNLEEVQVYLAKIKKEVDAGYHIYQKGETAWVQKPHE